MYIASTENYTGAYEEDSIEELIKEVAKNSWESEEKLVEVFQYNDEDVEVYVSKAELDFINQEIQEWRESIKIDIRDTDFYNQETRMLIYDRI